MTRVLDRYLERQARPEHRIASRLPERYDAAVVVPVRNESPELVEGLRAASRDARVLAVLVVNGRDDDPPHVHAGNAACLRALADRGPGRDIDDGVRWVQGGEPDLLLVDRSSGRRWFGARDGVGLARRIGSDIVAAMWAHGRLGSPWIHGTDADAVLGRDHFATARAHDEAVALVHPYWHAPSGDASLDEAVALYEIGLRWYVVGLAASGSPWSYATLGSCISVRIDTYAAVRGMPRRRAAEDFYLLAKVAKLGAVVRPDVAPVRLASRASDRVPFGTGPGVARLMALRAEGGTPKVYHPHTFDHLARTHRHIAAFAREPERVAEPPDARLVAAWQQVDLEAGMRAAVRSASSPELRGQRVCEWFDAFRTLKLVHALRDRGLAPVAWDEALAMFGPTADLAAAAARRELDAVRLGLAEREPSRAGCPRPSQ